MKKQILLLLLFVVVTGCYNEHLLDRSDDIVGPDTNSNGVRDDIDAYIDRVYTQPKQHAAAIQVAKVIQKEIQVDKLDDNAIRKLHVESARAINCLFEQSEISDDENPSVVAEGITSRTTNTKQRLLAYLTFSKASSGMVLSDVSGDTCE